MAVVKVMEVLGESRESFQAAVQDAVKDAAQSQKNITGVEVANWTAEVKGGQLVEFKADCRVAYSE